MRLPLWEVLWRTSGACEVAKTQHLRRACAVLLLCPDVAVPESLLLALAIIQWDASELERRVQTAEVLLASHLEELGGRLVLIRVVATELVLVAGCAEQATSWILAKASRGPAGGTSACVSKALACHATAERHSCSAHGAGVLSKERP